MEENRLAAILALSSKVIAFRMNASPKEQEMIDSAVITAKMAAASAAHQVNADLATFLMIVATELNEAALNAEAEKEG